MILLKNNLCMGIFYNENEIQTTNYAGIYYNDTRFFENWTWNFERKCVKIYENISKFEELKQLWTIFKNHTQEIAIERIFKVKNDGISESLKLKNYNIKETKKDILELNINSNFMDMMYIRNNAGFSSGELKEGYESPKYSYKVDNDKIKIEAIDQVGFKYYAEIKINSDFNFEFDGKKIYIEYSLSPKEEKEISINVCLQDDYNIKPVKRPDYIEFENKFEKLYEKYPLYKNEIKKSVQSIYALMSNYEDKWIITAGMPIFAVPFGRDSLISAYFVLPYLPEITRDTLLYLGSKIGNRESNYNQEEIGKIPHELRNGELSRIDLIPFKTYYGAADTTSLYIMILNEYIKYTKDYSFIEETKPIWEKALSWIKTKISSNYMIDFYNGNSMGLSVQSWKDSADSMNHKDGSSAKPPLYVSEVQGYTYKACLIASEFYDYLKNENLSKEYKSLSDKILDMINNRFWNEELGIYAMALDKDLKQLEVVSSDAGHMLWSETADKEKAKLIIKNLLSEEMFSGFGIRTLNSKAKNYNPNSYHNGSVWAHDTIICALGMNKYGFKEEASKVALGILEAAKYWGIYSLPELFSGYDNETWKEPIAYPEACSLQGWSSASLFGCLYILDSRDNK